MRFHPGLEWWIAKVSAPCSVAHCSITGSKSWTRTLKKPKSPPEATTLATLRWLYSNTSTLANPKTLPALVAMNSCARPYNRPVRMSSGCRNGWRLQARSAWGRMADHRSTTRLEWTLWITLARGVGLNKHHTKEALKHLQTACDWLQAEIESSRSIPPPQTSARQPRSQR